MHGGKLGLFIKFTLAVLPMGKTMIFSSGERPERIDLERFEIAPFEILIAEL